jgi:hypothetical protein
MDNKETVRSDYEEIKKEERKGKWKSFWITPTW